MEATQGNTTIWNCGDMEERYLFGPRPEKIQLSVENSKELMIKGLKYLLGDKYVWSPEYDVIADWLSDNKGRGLLCLGDSGRGKTFICERILLPIIENKYRNLKTCTLIGYTMNEEYGKNAANVYLLDDVGVESEGMKFGEKISSFNQIVNDAERYDWLLLITTNLTIEELIEKYGERAVDRLRAITRPVVFTGKSFRKMF